MRIIIEIRQEKPTQAQKQAWEQLWRMLAQKQETAATTPEQKDESVGN